MIEYMRMVVKSDMLQSMLSQVENLNRKVTRMKKKTISLFVATILILALTINASAGTAGKSGQTSGGTAGILNASASLTVYTTSASASTSVTSSASDYTVDTSLVYYCILAGGGITTVPGTGSNTLKTASNVGVQGFKGDSYHSVDGGSKWGTWGCQLTSGV